MAISGANFAIAETGTVCIVESEGNGRFCTTLPEDADHGDRDREAHPDARGPRGLPPAPASLVDRRADEPVHVASGPASRRATARRSSTSCSLDNGRTRRARRRGRPADAGLHPLQRLPQRLPGVRADRRPRVRARSIPGPIGAILTPQLARRRERRVAPAMRPRSAAPATRSVPSRSTSREVLVHLRGRVVARGARPPRGERAGDECARVGRSPASGAIRARPAASAALGRRSRSSAAAASRACPGLAGWTEMRDLPAPCARQTFREWWALAVSDGARGDPRRASGGRSPTFPQPSETPDDVAVAARLPSSTRPPAPSSGFVERVADYGAGVRIGPRRASSPSAIADGMSRPRRRPASPSRPTCPPTGYPGGARGRPATPRLDVRGARRHRRRRHRLRARDRARPGRSSSTPGPARVGERLTLVPVLSTSASSTNRSGRRTASRPRSRRLAGGAALAGRPITFGSPARPRPPTSSSTASRASTARAGSSWCWSVC